MGPEIRENRSMNDQETQAAFVLPAGDSLETTIAWFREGLGLSLESIWPADAPRVAIMSGLGLRLRLDRHCDESGARLEIECGDPARLAKQLDEALTSSTTADADEGVPSPTRLRRRAPNGTTVDLVAACERVVLPARQVAHESRLEFVQARESAHEGRAGMRYRDLLPSRRGGRIIASEILVETAGPIADYVHYHDVAFQVICCVRGSVRVVYQDQGEAFELHRGDVVLQAPGIRHRVLEASSGLMVVELCCPAEHATHADPSLELPNATLDPTRLYGGQRFVRHVASESAWTDAEGGWLVQRSEVHDATQGLAEVAFARVGASGRARIDAREAELEFGYVVAGSARLCVEDYANDTQHGTSDTKRLDARGAFALPVGSTATIDGASEDFELLRVVLAGML